MFDLDTGALAGPASQADADAHPQHAPTPHRLSGTVVWLLGRASLRGTQLTRAKLNEHGVGKWHYAVLAALTEFGAAAQAELGRRLGIDRSDMVAILNVLEGQGFVSRAPDPDDRRRNSVVLTEAGAAALTRFDRLIAEADDALLSGLSPAERQQLVGLLEHLIFPATE